MNKRIQPWDKDTARKELAKRLREASDYRNRFEEHWERNERLIFDEDGSLERTSINSNPEFGTYLEGSALDSANITQNAAYAFRNLQFIHSQMSANPPSVIAEPATTDPDDRLAAMAADRLVAHARQTYDMIEHIDLMTLNTLTYGIGALKIVWDSSCGEIVDIDEKGNLQLEGDIKITVPNPWDLFIDQHATSPDTIRYVIERVRMPVETAKQMYPEHEEMIERAAKKASDDYRPDTAMEPEKPGRDVELYKYWEKGLPENGYDGRHCTFLRDGTVLGKVEPNPHRFLAAETVRKIKEKYGEFGEDVVAAKLDKIPQIAELPFHFLSYVDVPQSVIGKSTLDYVGPIQENMNRVMLTVIDNAAAHGAVQLVLAEANEIADDSITNTPMSVIKVSGPAGPYHLQIPQLLGDMGPLMDRMRSQIDDIMGVNDSQFGTMKRETSNAALQSAAAQGSMIRRRLFNKYTRAVEGIYRQFLKLVRKHIDVDRLYHIIGKEHPLEAMEIKTMDLDGGYDLKVSYGSSFSLDPLTRRGEIMQMMPLFEKVGVPASTMIDMLQLNELRGMYDRTRVAKERQMEIFDEMIETGTYIRPEPNQDHVGMLAASLDYVMTREFFDLDEDSKMLITQHIEDRKQMGAQEQSQGTAGAPPGGMPPGGMPPGGMPPGGMPPV